MYPFEDLWAKFATMDIDNVSFDLVRAFPSVKARLEWALLHWVMHLVQVTRELLTSFEYLATGIIITAVLGAARRVNTPGSINGLDVGNEACRVCGFRWWKLRLSTGVFWGFRMRSGVRTELWRKHVPPLSEPPWNNVGDGISTLRASLSKLERQDVVVYLKKTLGKDDNPI